MNQYPRKDISLQELRQLQKDITKKGANILEQEIKCSVRREIKTVQFREIMTDEFIENYKQALSYSGLTQEEVGFRNVSICQGKHIHEIYTKGNECQVHLVALHGFGGSSLTFVRLLQGLRPHFQFHALDTPGTGLSSRGGFKEDFTQQQVADYYVYGIEGWRKEVGLEEMVLLGHSFGGYIAARYAQQYPNRVKSLLLLSPAGATQLTQNDIRVTYDNPSCARKMFSCIAQKVYGSRVKPSSVGRNCLCGAWLLKKVVGSRLKLEGREKELWGNYLWALCAVEESSETGFYSLLKWPLVPVLSIENIIYEGLAIETHFLFGDEDWMNRNGPQRLVDKYEFITLDIVPKAGHQLIFDNPKAVCDLIIKYSSNCNSKK